jgi:hypothetical protein
LVTGADVAAVPVAGWACAQAVAARHYKIAKTANDRIMKHSEEYRDTETLR